MHYIQFLSHANSVTNELVYNFSQLYIYYNKYKVNIKQNTALFGRLYGFNEH